jgi:hypothetical protein
MIKSKEEKIEKKIDDYFQFHAWLSNNLHNILEIPYESLDYKSWDIGENEIFMYIEVPVYIGSKEMKEEVVEIPKEKILACLKREQIQASINLF